MSEFIPAPWKCYTYEDRYEITDFVGCPIATTKMYRNRACSDETARLITLAPNMHELLVECLSFVPKVLEDRIVELLKEIEDE